VSTPRESAAHPTRSNLAAFKSYALASSATGNNTHAAVEVGAINGQVAAEFIPEVVGTTVTWKVQGSHDGTNFYDLLYVTDASDTGGTAGIANTTSGNKTIFLSNVGSRTYRFFRLVTSSNTGATYSAKLHMYSSRPAV
jgi:hypothetical protein